MAQNLILASGSPFRKALLANAGVVVVAEPARIDERAVEVTLEGSGATPEDLALVLAVAKADDVSDRHAGALVIGSDQTLSLDGEIFHKPDGMEGARRHLLRLQGKTHQLNSAVAIVRDGETLWSHVAVAHMTMRQLAPDYIGRFLAATGDKALSSVGAYQIESEGVRLFDRIDGDYFAIVGLPLLPLLAVLRDLGAIDD